MSTHRANKCVRLLLREKLSGVSLTDEELAERKQTVKISAFGCEITKKTLSFTVNILMMRLPSGSSSSVA